MKDATDKHMRRAIKALGFKGKNLPLSIADVVIHKQRPGEYEVIQYPGESRRAAIERLRNWAYPDPGNSSASEQLQENKC